MTLLADPVAWTGIDVDFQEKPALLEAAPFIWRLGPATRQGGILPYSEDGDK